MGKVFRARDTKLNRDVAIKAICLARAEIHRIRFRRAVAPLRLTRPSLASLRGTVLGAADFQFFVSAISNRFAVKDGKLAPLARDQWRSLRMEEQFDALLYLGPPSSITIARLPAQLCADAAYMKMRLRRLEAYGPKDSAEGLRQYCVDRSK
jgi:hypothetical protein